MSDEMLPAAEGKPKRYLKGKIKHVEKDPPQEILEDFDDYLDDAGTGMGMS